jgi:hypothetical protein
VRVAGLAKIRVKIQALALTALLALWKKTRMALETIGIQKSIAITALAIGINCI